MALMFLSTAPLVVGVHGRRPGGHGHSLMEVRVQRASIKLNNAVLFSHSVVPYWGGRCLSFSILIIALFKQRQCII